MKVSQFLQWQSGGWDEDPWFFRGQGLQRDQWLCRPLVRYRMIAQRVGEVGSSAVILKQLRWESRATSEERSVTVAIRILFNSKNGLPPPSCPWARCEERVGIPVCVYAEDAPPDGGLTQ